MATQNATTLTFEVYKGDTLVKTSESREVSVTIGSSETALLSIDDESLADLHAVINIEDDGSVRLLDLGSEDGIYMNGERVHNAPVQTGDRFQLGELTFVLRFEALDAFDDEEATHVVGMPQEVVTAAGALVDDDEPTDPGTPEDDQPEYVENTEDVQSFVLRSGTSQSNLGIDKKAPKVLEVNQMWERIVLDTKHYRKRGNPITIGSTTGHRWSFIGVEIGWVPAPLAVVLPFAPPMWSEVNAQYKNDFYTPDQALPAGQEHTLFKWQGNQYVADIAEGWGGFADVGEERLTFDELVARGKASKGGRGWLVPMDDDVKLMVDVDGTAFYSHMVHPGRRVAASIIDTIDFLFLGILALSAFIGLMFLLLVAFLPKPPESDYVEIDERFVDMLLQKDEKEEDKGKKPKANPDAGEGAKAKREEGKVGKKDAKMQKAKGNKVQMQKQQLDKQIAEDAGVLGALREGGMMDGFGGAVDASTLSGIGGLIGAKGTQIGAGGLGSRGSGLGGGGTADGLGGLGTKGLGSGASGYGRGGGNFGAKGEGAIGAVGGDPIILGALDRSLIDAVIKRHMNQIRYCYQRELTKNPALKGKLVVKFIIAKDGSVSSANIKSTTMNTPSVENCVVGRFMRMQFPKPKGGGIVIVSYPFIFSAG